MRSLASIVLLLAITPLHAQKANTPQPLTAEGHTLEQILASLGQDYQAYTTILPDFYADEKITSTYRHNSVAPSITFNGTSTFSIRRVTDNNGKIMFVENRDFKTINFNGKPVKSGEPAKAPLIPSGIFSYAFSILAPQYRQCFDFTLRSASEFHDPYGRSVGKHPGTLFITFTDSASAAQDNTCPPLHPANGTIMGNAKTMTVEYIRITVFHTHMVPGLDTTSTWHVGFIPIDIDGQSFKLPGVTTAIVSTLDDLWNPLGGK